MGKELVAALVTLGTAVVTASIFYQAVKPGSQAVPLARVGGDVVQGVTGTLFKG